MLAIHYGHTKVTPYVLTKKLRGCFVTKMKGHKKY
jgi:hypothetical protein